MGQSGFPAQGMEPYATWIKLPAKTMIKPLKARILPEFPANHDLPDLQRGVILSPSV